MENYIDGIFRETVLTKTANVQSGNICLLVQNLNWGMFQRAMTFQTRWEKQSIWFEKNQTDLNKNQIRLRISSSSTDDQYPSAKLCMVC